MTISEWQRESDRRRAVTGQSNINERLDKTNLNMSTGIAHIAGLCIGLKEQVALLISLVRESISMLKEILAVSRTNQRKNAKLTEVFIEALRPTSSSSLRISASTLARRGATE